MESFLQDLQAWEEGGVHILDATARLALAALLGVLLGIERARREQSAGMRTYAVVSMASALIMIVSIFGVPGVDGRPGDPGRIAAQVVSGIGFLGAGLIFMRRNVVHGLTTAASLWAVSGVGLAVGGGMMVTASVATALLLLISGGLRPVKQRFFQNGSNEHRVKLHLSEAGNVINELRELANKDSKFQVSQLDFESTSDKKESKIDLRLKLEDADDIIDVVKLMEQIEGVERVSWHVRNPDG